MTDSNNPDVDDDATMDERVELRTNAAGVCQESKDALKEAIATGTEEQITIFQTSCDNVCGETCIIATETTATKDSNANTNFISAILFVLMQFFM